MLSTVTLRVNGKPQSANAFANATGKRIRDLPLTPARVKSALA